MQNNSSRKIVNINNIQSSINIIFNELKKRNITQIDITNKNNLLWQIGIDDAFKKDKNKIDLNLESIQDSNEFIEDALLSQDGIPSIMLMHIISILFFVAKESKF